MALGFHYPSSGPLRCDDCSLADIARDVGTPTYVYSAPQIQDNARRLTAAFAPLNPLPLFAVKSCGNPEILRLIAHQGFGMDVVSGGELERVHFAGVPMNRVTFAGTGKTIPEIQAALSGECSLLRNSPLHQGDRTLNRGPIASFNAESEGELERIAAVAEAMNTIAHCSLRVNPNVDAHTHAYTTTGKYENKFGIDITQVHRIFAAWKDHPSLALTGIHCHLGSPISTPQPYIESLNVILQHIDSLQSRGIHIRTLNIGGGFGIDYGSSPTPISTIEDFAAAIVPLLRDRAQHGLHVQLEPGRVIVANAAILLTTIQYIKRGPTRAFAICDAGMHTLVRPALYSAYHAIWPVAPAPQFLPFNKRDPQPHPGLSQFDIVGPICESSDFLAKQRLLPPLTPGDLLAVFDAGAYGMSMASTYNDQPLPAEVLVQGSSFDIIRPRQTIADLLRPMR